ncbi:shikimate dehydrogenase family protein [Acuticoccus kandeliae]|uniref:shikimate dehydrogenase family protein n=1 Tax=Acuticoccus kandeliae TaxID=2073160 RepID=UPI000D3E94D6|nr:shikimate dehydrogenase [Acuticoccus kandeliae]
MGRRYIMIGAPVTSVRTPPLLEAWFAARGEAATCAVRHVEPEDLPALVDEVRADPGIDGLMVTMPHKRAILPLLDGLSGTARAAGSVNAVKRTANGLEGAQFDGIALVNALAAAGADLSTSRVTLAGLGGAGLAIALALEAAGNRDLTLVESDPARLAAVGAMLAIAPRMLDPSAPRPAADILVNATPLGMARGDPSPFGEAEVAAARLVADIVAVPNETRLADLARAAGIPLVTGYEMVTHQIEPIGAWLTAEA